MTRVTARAISGLVLSLALAGASTNTHKNIADTLRQFMTGYFRHYRAGYYVDDSSSKTNQIYMTILFFSQCIHFTVCTFGLPKQHNKA